MKTKKSKSVLNVRKFDKNKKRCSYQCPYYRDGSTYSWCILYSEAVRYDGCIPPLRVSECLED